MKPVITSIRMSSGPERKKPCIGDRRTTKKHGLQIRIPEIHDGMRVVANGRPCYVWCKPAELPAMYRRFLTEEERASSAAQE